jgi:hypothetical protein
VYKYIFYRTQTFSDGAAAGAEEKVFNRMELIRSLLVLHLYKFKTTCVVSLISF